MLLLQCSTCCAWHNVCNDVTLSNWTDVTSYTDNVVPYNGPLISLVCKLIRKNLMVIDYQYQTKDCSKHTLCLQAIQHKQFKLTLRDKGVQSPQVRGKWNAKNMSRAKSFGEQLRLWIVICPYTRTFETMQTSSIELSHRCYNSALPLSIQRSQLQLGTQFMPQGIPLIPALWILTATSYIGFEINRLYYNCITQFIITFEHIIIIRKPNCTDVDTSMKHCRSSETNNACA